MVKPPIYDKSAKLPEGTSLLDAQKQQWVLGSSIGQGGFGCIYSAKFHSSTSFDKVIKIEPSSNGPLFTEINFYKRAAKEDDIKKWMNLKKLDFLGMPRYINFGIHNNDRFLVMDRFGDDLHKTLMKSPLSATCILQITLNIIDILEYIHSMEYAHADIKALNIMRGFTSPSEIYLLDFGMVSKFSEKGVHRIEKIDPKCKNNGTVEFSPRDSHTGLQPSRRGDMESLLYNVIFWLSWDNKNPNSSRSIGFGKLPWLSILQGINSEKVSLPVINKVAESKFKHMENPKKFIESVGLDVHTWSEYLVKMLTKVTQYGYDEKPDYDGTRNDIVTIISEIDGKPLNLQGNRKVNWDHNMPRSSRKRPSEEPKIHSTKKKRSKISANLNNSNCEEQEIFVNESSAVSKKRIPNIFRNIANENDSKSCVKTKKRIIKKKEQTKDDENIMNITEKKSENQSAISTSIESVAKENLRETEIKITKRVRSKRLLSKNPPVAADMKSPLKANRGEIIPGMKHLEQIRLRRNQEDAKLAASTSLRSAAAIANSFRSPKGANIIPGLKVLNRYKNRKSMRISKPITSSPANSVRCQTSPSLSKDQ